MEQLSNSELLEAYKENELWKSGSNDKEFIVELFHRLLISESAFSQHYQKLNRGWR